MSEPRRDLRVCFVGDSFVAGHGDRTGRGWVGRVVAAAFAGGIPLTAYNLGVRRETSAQIAARLPVEVAPRLAPASDPRIVLSFGVNDTVEEGGAIRVPVPGTVQALRTVRAAAPSAAGLLLAGPPAVDDDRQNERIAATSDALRQEAASLGIPFVDCFAPTAANGVWRREVREGDGYHPGAAGYEVLAEVLTTPVLEWLGRQG